jgi:hypothetical protein
MKQSEPEFDYKSLPPTEKSEIVTEGQKRALEYRNNLRKYLSTLDKEELVEITVFITTVLGAVGNIAPSQLLALMVLDVVAHPDMKEEIINKYMDGCKRLNEQQYKEERRKLESN